MQKRERAPEPAFLAAAVGATFLMGSSFIAGKVLLEAGVGPIVLVGWRFLVAALATLPIVWIVDRRLVASLAPPRFGLRAGALVCVIGVLQTTGVMGFLFLAMQTLSPSEAAILLFTNPIWVALLGRLAFGAPVSATQAVGLCLGVVGVTLTLGVGVSALAGERDWTGEVAGLCSALCFSLATLVNRRARLPMSPWALTFWQMFVGAIALLAIAQGLGQHWPDTLGGAHWAWFFWLAIPASTGSFGLWFVALAKGGAGRASSFLFLAPLFAVAQAYLVMGTTLSPSQIVGGAIIALALWLMSR